MQMKRKLYFADLTHTAQGISAPTFPLGISFVVSYAKSQLDDDYEFRLFKFPSSLERTLRATPPDLLALSNYSWNLELAYKLATLAKESNPDLIVVFGGPNFPTVDSECQEYLQARPAMDFYVQLEGELGFVDLVRKLQAHNFSVKRLKELGELVVNTSYVYGDQILTGPVERIKDINAIPSPYLTGILDPFFGLALVPMVETTRGCPFSCTFCADGLSIKNRVTRYNHQRVREELWYIADRVTKCDEMIITDLNFGMYKDDLVTSGVIAEIQESRKWPVIVKASAGKNKPERTIEAASILKGSWVIGAAIQSSDPEVLRAIRRSNISSDAFQKFTEYSNTLHRDASTYSEIILGLPGDTKEKHFQSLRYSITNNVGSLRMYQAMLLCGTEMASKPSRKAFGLQTKFRTIPGCVGIYNFFSREHPVAEIEEIIVGSKSMSFEDYIECRLMNLIIETFYNNALFEELFAMVRTIGVPLFDCLLYLKDHNEIYTAKVKEIVSAFVFQTSQDLYDSYEETNSVVLTPEVIGRYIGGELGINELLVHKALLFNAFDDISMLVFTSVRDVLKQRGLFTPPVEKYLEQLHRFISHTKKDSLTLTDKVITDHLNYDFRAISDARFNIDPNQLPWLDTPLEYAFFHDDQQKQHIMIQHNVYGKTPIGLGRLIQRSNLKLIYRRFELKQPVVMV
jgi:radical SAM superfamily enzyme YgiQ (UPF0313 family)